MTYGTGTRSYNRSTEHRESKKQQADATARYLRGELGLGDCTVPLVCHCRSFHYPHSSTKHRELKGDWDWRTPEERGTQQAWPEAL